VRLADLALLVLCCAVWGVNLPLTRLLVGEIPPVAAAALRFAGIALVLLPLLRTIPKQLGTVLLVGLSIGGLHFALLFLGLASAPASAVAIVGQIGLPMVTVLSVIFLKEEVRARRMIGMTLAFVGVLVVLWKPGGFTLAAGLLFVVASAFVGSVGSILMKRMEPMPALQLQAWVGLISILPLVALSAVTETGQLEAIAAAPLWAWGALAFSIVVVSIFGHSVYYRLLKKYDVTLLAPLTLLTPIVAVATGVMALGEPVSWQLLAGGAITLVGVGLVAARQNKALDPTAMAQTRAFT
jgi:O-acetylserine/cysteine efflux transporter